MSTPSPRKLITFDWAMKRLLRSKANFEILEGFLSELLGEEIRILEILESESNKESKRDKSNRVDLKVKNSKGELVIIDVQFERQLDYLKRMLYGTSRVITGHQKESEAYATLADCRTNDREVGRKKALNLPFYFNFSYRKPYQAHIRAKKPQLAALYS